VVSVPMMSQDAVYLYAEGDGYQAIEMGYRARELAMLFILPDEGEFDRIESSLDGGMVGGIVAEMESTEVSVRLPKFTFRSPSIALRDTLVSMGMVTPFGGGADFSGIIEGGGIAISDAFHKTFIAVDEKGTEAAAATAVILVEYAPSPQIEFIADRPFLFLIRDRSTGVNLFAGRVVDPR